ncbi:hypothetical protein BOTBODRAFT_33829 [Botryobasidium botryosum FD-172 SS1]|uniref:C2 domain-containing protein n=1 Tax=Botryobasidium botryosum (strain FD-172 SS1) TaxID=930990 RepID=A0A067MES5_BOTB1|nr:hypothetical protein BOTBODRAFT_33829 [Botryobasidium botryosum FD-172 SS1]
MAQSSGAVSGTTLPDTAEELKIIVLSATNLPPRSYLHGDPKSFVSISARGRTWSTKVSGRSKNPQWGDEYSLPGDSSVTLRVELKVLHWSGFSHREMLVGAVEVRVGKLLEEQGKAHEEGSDSFTIDFPTTPSSAPQPSISLRVHRGPMKSEGEIDRARASASVARSGVEKMQTIAAPPTVPAHISDAASSAQNAVQAVASTKEVQEVCKMTLASVEKFMTFVKMIDTISEIHPYAKAAWTILSAGLKIIARQKDQDDALHALLESMSTALSAVCRFDKTALHKDDKDIILQVAKKTNECALFIQECSQTENFALRALKGVFSNADSEIARFKNDFDVLRKNADTGAILSIAEGLSGVDQKLYKIEESINDIGREFRRAAQRAILDKLPYAEGAACDPEQACLPNTREALLDDVRKWIVSSEPRGGAEIFCLIGVAGSGKSAIAHTVSHRCDKEGLLASSFFFSREAAEKRSPRKLFSTIARDIARDSHIRDHICQAIEDKQSLATASLSVQFDSLILEPCLKYPPKMPAVIVIDALDESDTTELLKIFYSSFHKLPQPFRLFVTSRDMPDIHTILSRSPHFHLRTIDIGTSVNLEDVRTYVRHGLGVIAERHGLGESWVSEELVEMFVSKAEGLFQWAAAVFQAVEAAEYKPVKKLESLLKGTQTGLAPEEKMDNIYTKILDAFDWKDKDFKSDYGTVMGAILAAKSPLSALALQSLHPDADISGLLSRLGALLTGWKRPEQPVRILHLSLRDFLTSRAPTSAPFYICEKYHSRRLGLLCLSALNESLKQDAPGVGYLEDDTPGIPILAMDELSAEVLYACEFWMDHIVEFEAPIPAELIRLLQEFLSMHLIPWMEVCASIGAFKDFRKVRAWIQQSTLPDVVNLMNEEWNSALGTAFGNLSNRLDFMARREDALAAGREAVDLYRQLAEDSPTAYSSNLAESLDNLSVCLSPLGHREGALAASREAVDLYRQLAEDRPTAFSSDLARALTNDSALLSALGRWEDALTASQEAVDLYQQLVRDRPAAFNFNLAHSLSNHSVLLSALGRREDALAVSREAVDLYRQLARDHPAAFSSDLARSLGNLSACLSALGQPEDALAASREALDLYRQLARDRPASFNSDLARSLRSLSIHLSALGRREDALAAGRECVDLYRQLAKDRPTAFKCHLATSLNSLSYWLSALGHLEDALSAVREAVELYRSLAEDRPAVFNSDLADVLDTLSEHLSALGHRESALAASKEAVELYRPLVADRPAAHNPASAEILHNLSLRLSSLDHHDDAVAAAREAVELYRPLAKDVPARYNSEFVGALRQLASSSRALGREEEALAAEQEAESIHLPDA